MKQATQRARWTDDRIASELRSVASEIGRAPTSTELRQSNFALSSAIARRGGLIAWANKIGAERPHARESWTDAEIEARLRRAAERYGRMPTANELRANGDNALACIIAHGDGFAAWAERLGLARKGTETHWGQKWELHEKRWLEGLGARVQKMPTRHPFDLAVNGHRVDVKASRFHSYKNKTINANGYVFAGLKRGECCDFFDLLCIGTADEVLARFVVPASEARVHTVTIAPLSLSGAGRYSRFRDAVEPLLNR